MDKEAPNHISKVAAKILRGRHATPANLSVGTFNELLTDAKTLADYLTTENNNAD